MSSESSTTNAKKIHLVWLDGNIHNRWNKKILTKLAAVDESIEAFDNTDDCFDYVKVYQKQQNQNPIFFIVSGALSETAIPKFHDFPSISKIFIFCRDPLRFEHLKFSKLREILDEASKLIDRLKFYTEENEVSVDFHFFNERKPKSDEHPVRDVQQDQTRFVWFYKWHQYMLNLQRTENDEEAKAEMIRFFRETFAARQSEIYQIEKFEKESCEENAINAIYWYTKSGFLFRSINEALVRSDIMKIYRFRYIIRLICQSLKKFDGNYRKLTKNSFLRLYRGSALRPSQINEMVSHVHDLICMNSFLSTSTDEDIAIDFSRRRLDDGLQSVLFVIDVDLDYSQNITMADVRKLSHFSDEDEVLISIGSIFSVQSVDRDEKNDLYRIHLTLGDVEKLTVNKYLEETYQNDAASSDQAILFGKLLYEMGEHALAIEYLRKCLENLSDQDNYKRPIYLNNIGICYNELGDKTQAFKFYNLALKIFQNSSRRETEENYYQNELGACYHNIASYHFILKENEEAYSLAIAALSKRQNFPLGRAATFDLLGYIQLIQLDNVAAKESFRQALNLRLNHLKPTNPHHPDIAVSYENLARLSFRSMLYEDAEKYFQRAADIYRHNFPKTHPRVTRIEENLSKIRSLLSNDD